MSKDNKTVLLQEFLNHWIAGDRKLQYLKDKAPEDFSELISLARVLEIYNINITSDTDVTTKYGQSPDFIVHVTNPKLYIEVTRAGTGYTTKERFCRFIKDAADKQQFNLDTLTIKKFLERIPYRLDNTEVEQKHGSQCTPIFCSHLLRELLTDRTIKNLNPVDRYSFIQTLLLFCQETLSNKHKSLKAFSEYTQCYNLCIGLLEIQLASYCNSSGLNSVTLRNELIDNLKPFIQDFAHLVDKQYLGKLPSGISQYCNYANTEEVYYAFVDSIVSQLLKKMLSQLESLAPSNFQQKYPNAGNTYCIGEGPENNEVDQIVKAIEAKFKTYNNNEKGGGMGILVVKSEPHFFNIFTSNIPLKYAAKIVDRLNAHSIENTYFNKVLIIGEAYKKDQIYIYKSENELWELRQIVH